jgi:hypothetical protein
VTSKNIKDLKPGYKYPILTLKLLDTKFGKSVNAVIEDIGGRIDDLGFYYTPHSFKHHINFTVGTAAKFIH